MDSEHSRSILGQEVEKPLKCSRNLLVEKIHDRIYVHIFSFDLGIALIDLFVLSPNVPFKVTIGSCETYDLGKRS